MVDDLTVKTGCVQRELGAMPARLNELSLTLVCLAIRQALRSCVPELSIVQSPLRRFLKRENSFGRFAKRRFQREHIFRERMRELKTSCGEQQSIDTGLFRHLLIVPRIAMSMVTNNGMIDML